MQRADRRPEVVRIFATGETRGHLKPCKCEQGQLGGLARRAAYLAGIAKQHDLRIDLGNAAAGAGAVRGLRLSTTLTALAGMGYQVFVPGELEAVIADELQREVEQHAGLTIVSANLIRDDGTRPFASHALARLPDGRTVAVIGLTQPVRPLPAGWRFIPAREALESAVAELEGTVDGMFVASSLDVADTTSTISGLSAVTLALSSSDAKQAPDDVGFSLEDLDPTVQHVAVVANFSTYVRCVDVDARLRPVRTWRAWLSEDVPGLPETAAVVRRHRELNTAMHPTLVPDILRAKREAGFAGSAVCAECHPAEHASWQSSAHAHAMQTLVREGAARDPDCVPCHLVDIPASGTVNDARSTSGDALGVGCEACHGARKKHVETAMLGVVPPGGGPTWPARAVCTGCHRPPEVRHFEFEAAWPLIVHGRK